MKRRIVVLTCFVMALLACFNAVSAQTAANEPIEELVVGLTNLPLSMDPIRDGGLSALAVYSLVFDRLISVDSEGNPIPGLAVSWEAVEPTVWELKLREGVTFHNGEVFDAESAKFSIDQTRLDENSQQLSNMSNITDVLIVDSYTIQVVTEEPMADLPSRMVLVFCYSEKYFNEVGGGSAFALAPVGTGPFVYVDGEADNFINLERNENYWGEKPNVLKLRALHLPDATARVTSVESGEVDVAYVVDPEQATRLAEKGFNVIDKPLGQAFVYFFRTGLDTPLSNKLVRQAINYAVDKDEIVDALFYGYTSPLQGQPVGSNANGFDASIPAYEYDVEKAKSLLAEAGFPDGFTIYLDTTSGVVPKDKDAAEVIAGQLSAIGIEVVIEINERGVFFDKLFNANMSEIWSLSLNYAPTMNLQNPLFNFTCGTAHQSNCDPEYDELQAKWASEFDPELKKVYAGEALKKIHDDAYGLFLWQVPGVHVSAKALSGLVINSDYTMDLTNVSYNK